MGLPTVDPFRQGAGRLVDALDEARGPGRDLPDRRGLHHQPRLAHRGEGADRDGRGWRPAGPRRVRALRPLRRDAGERDGRRSRGCRSGSTGRRCRSCCRPGAARNAVDCALWDLAAKRAGRRVWQLAGLPEPGPEVTAYTLSLDTPEAMRAQAARNAHRPLLEDQARRRGRHGPARGGAGGGAAGADHRRRQRGLDGGSLRRAGAGAGPARGGAGRAAAAGGRRTGRWPRWRGRCRSAPTRAATTAASLAGLAGKYDVVNVKLDKTGGLTEALALREAARAAGFGVMVGCMVGSSLAMAPAVLVAQGGGLHRPRRAAALGA